MSGAAHANTAVRPLAPMPQATPTDNTLALRVADFDTLTDALDYAAQGVTGSNFYNARGELTRALTYTDLRRDALDLAQRFASLGLPRQARVALVAETDPDFVRLFFACQYAGLVPVPLPAAVHLGGRDAFIGQLRTMLAGCQATVAIAPPDFAPMLHAAAVDADLEFCGTPDEFRALPLATWAPQPAQADELAYLQYTSGSTRFPRGVMITHRTVMQNLQGIVRHGLAIRDDDRFMSWLPFYHDMGLVGLVFSPLAAQRSVDYLGTRDFAMRPRQWLALMSRNRATIAFSDALRTYGLYALGGLVAAIAALLVALRDPARRLAWHRLLAGMPVIGPWILTAVLADWCRGLGTLLASGVPVLSALAIASTGVGNLHLRRRLEAVNERVSQGNGLAVSLKAEGVAPGFLPHMVASGEASSELDQMLIRVSDYYSARLKNAIDTMLKLLEPALVVFMGAVVLLIVGAVLVPIVKMNQLI